MFFYICYILSKISIYIKFSRFSLLYPFRTISISIKSYRSCLLC